MTLLTLNDLRRQNRTLHREIAAATTRVLDSGWYVHGPELRAFEEEFAAFVSRRHCVGVGNGTDALELALRALDVGPGDEVLTVANAGMYATAACVQIGARPVYVDVEPATLTMSPAAARAAVGPLVRAVVVTHLYGYVADVDAIREAVGPTGPPIVEDCAQAHGGRLRGRPAGSLGDVATFSFYPTKNLGACGDGGAVVTDDGVAAARLTKLRQYGWGERYHAELSHGRNSRLDEIQAAILRVKLPHVDGWNAARRRIHAAYRAATRGTGLHLDHPDDERFVAHLCVARCRDRDAVRNRFREAGVATDVHYPVLDFRQAAVAELPHRVASAAESERAVREILTLPCHPDMTAAEIDRVREAIGAITSG
jgi:dTDP-4-amino-4,6-dideoxygalactose transaminase